MLQACVVTAHHRAAPNPGVATDCGVSRSIAAQAHAICEALRRLGLNATVAGNSPRVRPDFAVIELDRAAVANDPWISAVAHLKHDGVPLLVRHHDAGVATEIFPVAEALGVLHAAPSLRIRRELIALGYPNVALLPYCFDAGREIGESTSRQTTRAELDIDDTTILLLQPTRISERKNLAGSIRYLQQLARVAAAERLHFWVTGPTQPEFQAMVEKLLPHLPVRYTIREVSDIATAYAACDAVLYPSTSERFGPVIFEAVQARRPCVVGGFAALGEIEAQGIQLFSLDEPAELLKFLAKPAPRLHDVNQRRAALAFGPEVFDAAVHATIQLLGVTP